MGSKVIARQIMTDAGIPVIPGTEVLDPGAAGEEEAIRFAEEYGFPIMIKAVAGGGGRGIRAAQDVSELIKGLKMARSEAQMAFGNDEVYLEKALSTRAISKCRFWPISMATSSTWAPEIVPSKDATKN